MEPNQNQGQAQEPVEAPMPERNAFPQGPVTEKKTGNGMLIGMILCALIALGGVGFGVWAMMDGNTQKEQLNSQISAIKKQNEELLNKINDDEHNNPIIKSNNPGEKYRLSFYSSNVYWDASGDFKSVLISVDEDENISCQVRRKGPPFEECSISGLEGSIYKIVEFGTGQDNVDNNIGFIMTDGTVKYMPLYDSILNNNFSIRGNVELGDFVVDAFEIAVSPTDSPVGGHAATVFVFRDGSYKKFDKSMVE